MSRFLKLFAVAALVAMSLGMTGTARAGYQCAYYYPFTCPSPGDYDSGAGWAGDYGYAPYYYAHDYDDPGPAVLAGMLLGGAIGYGMGYGSGVVINNNVGGFNPGFHHRGFHHAGRFDHHHHFDHHGFDHHHFHHADFHHGPHHFPHHGMHPHPAFHHH
ncbi:MAG TPA: hypothetical protein VN632_08610 [Stellaceae bacterium]|nr:hypothetical protein [Stellaceae bacterium]